MAPQIAMNQVLPVHLPTLIDDIESLRVDRSDE